MDLQSPGKTDMPAPQSPSPIAYTKARRALRAHANPERASVYRWYFKDPGKDIFLGVSTREMRQVAREFRGLPMTDVRKLMRPPGWMRSARRPMPSCAGSLKKAAKRSRRKSSSSTLAIAAPSTAGSRSMAALPGQKRSSCPEAFLEQVLPCDAANDAEIRD
jgi:DNA alkylation repair enzyme